MRCRGGSCSVAADLLCVLWLLWVVSLEEHWHQRPSLLLALAATKIVYWLRQKGNAASHQLSSGPNNELCLLSSLSSHCGVSFSWISCRICTRIEALKAGPQCLCSNRSYPRKETGHVHQCVCMLFLMHPGSSRSTFVKLTSFFLYFWDGVNKKLYVPSVENIIFLLCKH